MSVAELAVALADFLRHRGPLNWVMRTRLFNLLKEDVLRTLLVDLGGLPVDSGIRPILRRYNSRSLPRVIPSRLADGSALSILLVQPPLPANLRHKVIVPVGLAYIAAQIREKLPNVRVGILDALAHDLPPAETAAICGDRQWQIVGISAMTCQIDDAYALCAALRQADPAKKLILGGVHPTLCPDEAAAHADAVVIGEGEETVLDLLERAVAGKLWAGTPGTCVSTSTGLVTGPARPMIDDLDRLAFPAYDLLSIHLYNNPLHVVGGERLPLFASRGCPFACSFCNSPQIWHRRVRFRSPANVLAEVDWIVNTFGIRKFHFWDDNLFLRPATIRPILEGFVARGGLRWVGLDRAESVVRHADLLPLARQSGCVGIEIGVESVNPDTFAYIQKGQGQDVARDAVRAQKEAGLSPLCTYMAFNPGETISGYRYQKMFLDQLQQGLPWYQFFHQLSFPIYVGQFATPYPGTPFNEQLATVGRSLADTRRERFHHAVNFMPRSLLEDVPQRIAHIGSADLDLLYTVIMTGLWDWFPGTTAAADAAQRLKTAATVVRSFLDRIDGQLSVAALADVVAEATGIGSKETLQVIAIVCYVFGQTGHLASARAPVADGRPVTRVTLPRFYRHLMRRLRRLGGF